MVEAAMTGSANVEVEINDGGPAKMEVDTGAYHAGIDTRFGEKIKAAMRGSSVGATDAAGKLTRTKLMQVRSFKIGGSPAKVDDLRLATFGFYSPSGIVGLMGMDILGQTAPSSISAPASSTFIPRPSDRARRSVCCIRFKRASVSRPL